MKICVLFHHETLTTPCCPTFPYFSGKTRYVQARIVEGEKDKEERETRAIYRAGEGALRWPGNISLRKGEGDFNVVPLALPMSNRG